MIRSADSVYFLRVLGEPAVVKVGYSAMPEHRLATLIPWSPYPLEIAARAPGGHREELGFHRLLAPSHSRNEWFNLTRQVSDVIAQVADGSFNMSSLPMFGPLPYAKPRLPWQPMQHVTASMAQQLRLLRKETGIYDEEISGRAWRFSCGRYAAEYGRRADPADALAVRAFLRQHGRDLNAKANAALDATSRTGAEAA